MAANLIFCISRTPLRDPESWVYLRFKFISDLLWYNRFWWTWVEPEPPVWTSSRKWSSSNRKPKLYTFWVSFKRLYKCKYFLSFFIKMLSLVYIFSHTYNWLNFCGLFTIFSSYIICTKVYITEENFRFQNFRFHLKPQNNKNTQLLTIYFFSTFQMEMLYLNC